ncbi:hypothetical protein ERX46_11420 [Brumimicrobium glaciale]|uniref:Uncharacterized protein n=1 Tax=Brumimicrobium glaciale TaxID=200475 RepID=A0A4Q4KJT1_9FLAO|nr:hypothetical protein [Brumimicrobium glaciale]RYM33541.1 hypothetical protein ERX46_11420 [Brumimicrobium glaciale]
MKFKYRTIVYVLFVFCILNSCKPQCSERIGDQEVNLYNAMNELYKDSFNLTVEISQDTLFVDVKGLPTYTTGKDYNHVLFGYLMYNLNLDSVRSFHKIKTTISHDCNGLYYRYNTDLDRVNLVTIDFYAIENYINITKFILKNFSDREAAFADLIFEPVSEYYPKITFDEGLYNLLLKLHVAKNRSRGNISYSVDNKYELEFALMWLYYSSDFSFEDLSFQKDLLEEYIMMSNIKIKKDLNRKDLDEFYKKHFG